MTFCVCLFPFSSCALSNFCVLLCVSPPVCCLCPQLEKQSEKERLGRNIEIAPGNAQKKGREPSGENETSFPFFFLCIQVG